MRFMSSVKGRSSSIIMFIHRYSGVLSLHRIGRTCDSDDNDYNGSDAHGSLALHDGISLDLNQPIRVDKAHDLYDRIRGADAPKELAVDSGDSVSAKCECGSHLKACRPNPQWRTG
jgi:hypothetical protein